MITQVIFKIDKKLKDQAMKKAQKEGIAFASVLKLATQAYVKGSLDVELVPQERLNAKTRRELIKISKDIKEGKNLSPVFTSVEEMRKYLMR
jgi:antitoxin component of RelBE/YafQ-DinJ toxin-antitoxin module